MRPEQRAGTWEEILGLDVVTYACREEGRSEGLWVTETVREAAPAGHDLSV